MSTEETNPNDAALLALAFVEALIMQRGDKAQAVAQLTKDNPAELGEMFYTTSKILAVLLEDTHGLTGAIERVHAWRQLYLHPEAAQWSD